MKRYSERAALTTLSEINVTPLIDLAFTLLIIFMILTPLIDKSMDLVAPTSMTATTEIDPAKVRTVSIDRFEVLKLDNDIIDFAGLESALRQMNEQGQAQAVVVRAHFELPVQRVVDIMDTLQRAGITRVSVVTREPQREGKAAP